MAATMEAFARCRQWQMDHSIIIQPNILQQHNKDEEDLGSGVSSSSSSSNSWCRYHYNCRIAIATAEPSYVADFAALLLLLLPWLLLCLCIYVFINSNKSNSSCLIKRQRTSKKWRIIGRYLIPSGTVSLPLTLLLLALAQSQGRATALWPVPMIAPAWLQLLHMSALAAESFQSFNGDVDAEADIDTVEQLRVTDLVSEVSVASGLLHASMYVEALTLPFYTALDAFLDSVPSGACGTCVCRRHRLVAGGRLRHGAGGQIPLPMATSSLVVVSALLTRLLGRLLRLRLHGRVVAVGRALSILLGWVAVFRELIQLTLVLWYYYDMHALDNVATATAVAWPLVLLPPLHLTFILLAYCTLRQKSPPTLAINDGRGVVLHGV